MTTAESERLAEVAMQIILHAGNARTQVRQALTVLEDGDNAAAEQLLNEAKADLTRAHQAQTAIVQAEARGEQTAHSLLFAHAQDTLMTIMTEHGLAQHLVRLFAKVDQRLTALEAKGESK
ncbi:PTS lactose/cellobiose transporter subunit IIA [Streptomyces arenae]|uniref:PTS lactose/cellobiose transporter subunit IIA n=1 Tax=Streptomyces arenae TaxID=29301 RepID=UPI00265B3C2F|nr:PTS lactose/cellobiose transporter subunit IIA [Streptomyces arenae]MCG7205113.1 PTS lactose/cellobiose transporter subunit IIA [Streptomyces arenae]